MERRNYKAVILKVLLLVLVFALGSAVGGYIGFKYAAVPFIHMNDMFRLGFATEYASLQYSNAGYSEAKEALLKLITVFEHLNKDGWYDNEKHIARKKYYIDTGVTYARLSLLEEKNGNIVGREKFMHQAMDRLQRAGWKDYSEQKIRDVVERQDRENEFKKKEKK